MRLPPPLGLPEAPVVPVVLGAPGAVVLVLLLVVAGAPPPRWHAEVPESVKVFPAMGMNSQL